jgi:hypothetical protein
MPAKYKIKGQLLTGTILRVNGELIPPRWYLAAVEPWVEIVIVRGDLTLSDFDVEVVDG